MHAIDVEVGATYQRRGGKSRVLVVGIWDPGFLVLEKDGDGEIFRVDTEELERIGEGEEVSK